MIWKLALLFTVIPMIEVSLLVTIGWYLGPIWATLVVVLTGFLGAWLAKREGMGVLRKLRADLQKGLPPAGRIVEGVLVLAGGLLLVTPGVLTDLTGFALIIPFTRRLIAPIVTRWAVRWFTGDPELARQVSLNFGDDDGDDSDSDEPTVRSRPSSSSAPNAPTQGPFDHPVR